MAIWILSDLISVEQEAVAKASGMFSIIGGIGGLIAPTFLVTWQNYLVKIRQEISS